MAVNTPTPPTHDEDGNLLGVPPAETPVGQLIYLIEWCRLRGVRLGPTVQIGELVVQVRDLRQNEQDRAAQAPDDPGPWAAAGYTGP